MHSVEELGTNVPAFLAKLWKMVEDTETNDLICWSPSGTSFYIRDQAKFARELLPLYYKHNNMASFVRQLNMYGFHKVVSIESGGLKIDRDDMEFAHQCFLMGHPYLLEHIKRKIPSNKSDDGRAGTKPELVNKVLSEVKSLKGRQDNVDSQLSAMKRENEVLWREVAILRQKHIKQQQIVNKLIQFLVSMVQTSRGSGIGIKRHYPLMLNDTAHHSKKSSKLNGSIADSNSSPTGPVIHELDPAELLDDCSPSIDDDTSPPVFDLCDAVSKVTSSGDGTSASAASGISSANTASSDQVVTIVNGSLLDTNTSEMLLTLTEECPKSSNVGLGATGDHHASIEAARKSKGKQKSVFKGSKRRKSKLMPSLSKPQSRLVTVKTEQNDSEDPVNVNNFLEIMLPSLVSDVSHTEGNRESVVSDPVEEVALPDISDPLLAANQRIRESSLDAATNAAISAISNVAAEATATAVASGSKTNTPITFPSAATKDNVLGEKSVSETDDSKGSGASSKDLTLACAALGDSYKCKEDFDAHVDSMQNELETLKELLKGEGYNLDANMLLGVCAAGLGIDASSLKLFGEDSLPYGLSILQNENLGKDEKSNGVSDLTGPGSELMTYSSNFLDLEDMAGFEDWGSPVGSNDMISGDISDELNTPLVAVNSPGFSGAVGKKK